MNTSESTSDRLYVTIGMAKHFIIKHEEYCHLRHLCIDRATLERKSLREAAWEKRGDILLSSKNSMSEIDKMIAMEEKYSTESATLLNVGQFRERMEVIIELMTTINTD
ncbi:Protein of unknown function [Pyronema omphalodes CBS 100304]|uniref:Uncharacterized protein n=1 Tax=Pyronema omphalodes (strain CBS 100304) TaxID=1076935 RepID=U4L3A3_PYROM|nr:Protein of unknown function [Pyronema omphalodes CBS 100304]